MKLNYIKRALFLLSDHHCDMKNINVNLVGCFLGVSWVFSVYPGCGCCVVEGKLVPDGFSWTIGSYPVQTWECCRGKIVRVTDLTQQPSTKTTATTETTIMTTHTTTTSTTTSTTTAASTIGCRVVYG